MSKKLSVPKILAKYGCNIYNILNFAALTHSYTTSAAAAAAAATTFVLRPFIQVNPGQLAPDT